MGEPVESIIKQIREESDIFNKARLIKYLIKEHQLRIIDLEKKLNLKSSYLCHLLRLNDLPPLVIDGYYSGLVSLSHLFVLSRFKDKKKLINLYEEVLSNNLTVAKTEERLREIIYQIENKGQYIDKEKIKQLTDQLKKIFPHLKIKLIQTRIKGKLSFEIKDNLEGSSKMINWLIDKLTK